MKFLKIITNSGKEYEDCYFKVNTIDPRTQRKGLYISFYSKQNGFLASVTHPRIEDTGEKVAYVCDDPDRDIDVTSILAENHLAIAVGTHITYYEQSYVRMLFDLNKLAEFSEIE